MIVSLYPAPPPGGTLLALDQVGPMLQRCFPRAGLVLRQALDQGLREYSRELEKVWVHRTLRGRDGRGVTLTARPRNSIGYVGLLDGVEQVNPCVGVLYTAFEEGGYEPASAQMAYHRPAHFAPVVESLLVDTALRRALAAGSASDNAG